jgi:hypothetical protein
MRTAQLAQPFNLIPDIPTTYVQSPTGTMDSIPDQSAFGLVELMLKNPQRLDCLIRDESRQAELIPRFLAISIVAVTIFGLAATVILNATVALGTATSWPTGVPAANWGTWSVGNLTIAYVIGLIAATGICLPTFYFFGLLAGVNPTMLGVLTHAMKGKSVGAITLVGILPIYVAVVLGMIVFRLPAHLTELTLYGALALPWLAGLNGVRSLYVGFMGLTDTIAPEHRCERRCLLRRLVVSWSMCYAAVQPLMIYTLWQHFSS